MTYKYVRIGVFYALVIHLDVGLSDHVVTTVSFFFFFIILKIFQPFLLNALKNFLNTCNHPKKKIASYSFSLFSCCCGSKGVKMASL